MQGTQTWANAIKFGLVLSGAAEISQYDIYVYQPRPHHMKSLRAFVPPADAGDSYQLRDATDQLLSSFDPEDPRERAVISDHPLPIAGPALSRALATNRIHFHAVAGAIGIEVKAGCAISQCGGHAFVQINLHGSCHKETAPGVDRSRGILDDHDGWLAGLLDSNLPGSNLPSSYGTHADSTLLYVVSTAPGVQHALLSKVPLRQIAGLLPKECYQGFGLKLPVSLQHPAWDQLYNVFERVTCELAVGDGNAFCNDMQSALGFKVLTGAALG